MIHTVSITDDDHIAFQLFDSSTNALKIKNRRKSWIFIILFGVITMLAGYTLDHNFLMYYGVVFTVLGVVFGNVYLKWRYKRHYVSHVKNYRKDVSDEVLEVEIVGDLIKTSDQSGDITVKISEIKVAEETANHYFLRISTGYTLIIPKTDIDLNAEVDKLIKQNNIPHTQLLDWKWS